MCITKILWIRFLYLQLWPTSVLPYSYVQCIHSSSIQIPAAESIANDNDHRLSLAFLKSYYEISYDLTAYLFFTIKMELRNSTLAHAVGSLCLWHCRGDTQNGTRGWIFCHQSFHRSWFYETGMIYGFVYIRSRIYLRTCRISYCIFICFFVPIEVICQYLLPAPYWAWIKGIIATSMTKYLLRVNCQPLHDNMGQARHQKWQNHEQEHTSILWA